METAEYWPMTWEYAIWNATIASLQFWGRRPWSNYPRHSLRTHLHHLLLDTLHQLSEDVLFGCYFIALNAAFTQQLSLADEGYESDSDTVDLPTPLRKTPRIHHMSSMEHASFNPVHTTPHSTVTITPLQFTMNPYQTSALLPIIYLWQFAWWTWFQTALQYTQTVQMRKKIFQQYHKMTNIGHQR